ncbi:MAG: sulfatase-like hydrolase/transferase, partial [Candidatus Binatia bacterium]
DFRDIRGAPSSTARTLRKERFDAFLHSIEPCEKHCLHYLHILLPHGPWYYLPSGKTYFRDDVFDKKTLQRTEHEWPLIEIYQRHLLQVAFVDNLLGKLIARLKALEMFDPSLIVVTADHGRSFWPGELGRNTLKAAHPEDILTVPLFIKAPYQKTGSVSDRNVETIDILPMIADLLKLDSDWTFDGCSPFAAGCAERPEKILIRGPKRRGSFPSDIGLRTDTLKRKIALFGSGAKPHGLFAVGSYPHLVGRNVSEIGIQGGAAEGASVTVVSPLESPASSDYVPARFAALLHSAEEIQKAPQVAVAVNGVIEAVVPAVRDDRSRWVVSAMVPEDSLRESGNKLQFFLVQGGAERPRLLQIPSR